MSASLSHCEGSVCCCHHGGLKQALSAGACQSLAAAKSRVGHAETAAGAVGLSRTLEVLEAAAQAPVHHLADFNAYVGSTLDAAAKESVIKTSIVRQVRFYLLSLSQVRLKEIAV